MANQTSGNPIVMDDWGTDVTLTNLRIRLMQWVDAAADIADNDDCVFIMDGTTVTLSVQKPSDVGHHAVTCWEAGPFDPPLRCNTFVGSTLTHGAFIIWLA